MKFLVVVHVGPAGSETRDPAPADLRAALQGCLRLCEYADASDPSISGRLRARSHQEAEQLVEAALHAAAVEASVDPARIGWAVQNGLRLVILRRHGEWHNLARPRGRGGPASVREPRRPGPRGFPPAQEDAGSP